jgi:hypothetical protein
MSAPRSSFVLMSALKSWRHFEVEINCPTIVENFEIIYNGATKNIGGSQLMSHAFADSHHATSAPDVTFIQIQSKQNCKHQQ